MSLVNVGRAFGKRPIAQRFLMMSAILKPICCVFTKQRTHEEKQKREKKGERSTTVASPLVFLPPSASTATALQSKISFFFTYKNGCIHYIMYVLEKCTCNVCIDIMCNLNLRFYV